MFGYVSPLKEELDEGQNDTFKAYYCGVCKQMGGLSRMTLSFECAFIACTMGGQGNTCPEKRACPANPFRRRYMVLNEATAYGADINIILAYHKAQDDVHDDGGLKPRLIRLMLRRQYRKACRRRPDVGRMVVQALERLNELERTGCDSSDMIAHEFADLFQGVADPEKDVENAHGPDSEARRRLFYNIGRWIYLIDAVADYEDDMKSGNYNVLALEWGDHSQALEAMDFSLWHTLSEAELAVKEIGLGGDIGNIVDNVVTKSLPVTTMATLCKGGLKPEPV